MSQRVVQDCSFTEFADAYNLLRGRGEAPSLEVLAAKFPQFAKEIEEQLPTMMLLEDALVPQSNNLAPKTINGCVIEREIGRGGMGVVFVAYQPEFDRKIAIKVTPKSDDQSNIRDQIEQKALSRLQHPNIVQSYSFESDSENSYLLMQYIEGHSLRQLLDATQLSTSARYFINRLRTDWIELATFARDIASALEHAHQNGVIHRDIKPSNLLVDSNGKVWVADFGLAKTRDMAPMVSRTGDIIGTLHYMSPEQLRGVADSRSDIYSLGLVLMEIVSGKSLMQNHVTSDSPEELLKSSSGIPVDLAKIIVKACKIAPDDRFQSAGEMAEVLNRYLAGKVADRRFKKRLPDDKYKKWARRRAITMILSSVICFGGIAWLWAMIQRAPETQTTTEIQEDPDLLNILTDESEDELGLVLSDLVSKSLDESTAELDLPEDEIKRIRGKIGDVLDSYENDESYDNLLQAFDRYRNSPIKTARNLIRLIPVIRESSFLDIEKTSFSMVVQQYAYLVVKNHVPRQDAEAAMKKLLYGNKPSTAHFELLLEKDTERFRVWLDDIHQVVARFDQSIFNNASIEDEITSLFSETER